MSNDYYSKNGLSLTAFVGPDRSRNMLQITTDSGWYTTLDQRDQIEFALQILARSGYFITATGEERLIIKEGE